MFRHRTIGILGGMGPIATVRFYQLFVRAMNARGLYDDSDFPRMIVNSIPLDDWGTEGAIKTASVCAQVCEGVRWLSDVGAEIIAVPCNSVHEFHNEMQMASSVPVLDIIDATLDYAIGENIGVLCSQQTRRAGLYARRGHRVLYHDQPAVDGMIDAVLRGKRPRIDDAIMQLRQRGAVGVILGCTELSLCERGDTHPIDSSEALSCALIEWLW